MTVNDDLALVWDETNQTANAVETSITVIAGIVTVAFLPFQALTAALLVANEIATTVNNNRHEQERLNELIENYELDVFRRQIEINKAKSEENQRINQNNIITLNVLKDEFEFAQTRINVTQRLANLNEQKLEGYGTSIINLNQGQEIIKNDINNLFGQQIINKNQIETNLTTLINYGNSLTDAVNLLTNHNHLFDHHNHRITFLETEFTDKLQFLPQINTLLSDSFPLIFNGLANNGQRIIEFDQRLTSLENSPPNPEMTPQEFETIFSKFSDKIIVEVNQNEGKIDALIDEQKLLLIDSNNSKEKIDELLLRPLPETPEIPEFDLSAIIKDVESANTVTQDKIDQQRQETTDQFVNLGLKVGTLLAFDRLSGAAKSGACNAINGGCGVNGGSNISVNEKLDLINAGLTTTSGVTLSQQIKTFTDKWDLFKGKFDQLYTNLGIDRALKIMDTALLIHNAAMLSNNLLNTLGDTVDVTLQAIGFEWKDENNNPIQFTEFINSGIKDFIIGIVGANNYTNAVKRWNSYNRIYQQGANLLIQTRSLFSEAGDYTELILEKLGKWMNVARKDGLVKENSYPKQNEQVPPISKTRKAIEKFTNGVEEIEESLDSIAIISSSGLGLVQEFNDLKSSKEEFETLIKDEINVASEEEIQDKQESQINPINPPTKTDFEPTS